MRLKSRQRGYVRVRFSNARADCCRDDESKQAGHGQRSSTLRAIRCRSRLGSSLYAIHNVELQDRRSWMRYSCRMFQPAPLKSDKKLFWSAGRGTDVWALFQACIAGDLDAVRALVAQDPSLVRAHFHYRKPLY